MDKNINEALKQCKFYKGEEDAPQKLDMEQKTLWYCERCFCFMYDNPKESKQIEIGEYLPYKDKIVKKDMDDFLKGIIFNIYMKQKYSISDSIQSFNAMLERNY